MTKRERIAELEAEVARLGSEPSALNISISSHTGDREWVGIVELKRGETMVAPMIFLNGSGATVGLSVYRL